LGYCFANCCEEEAARIPEAEKFKELLIYEDEGSHMEHVRIAFWLRYRVILVLLRQFMKIFRYLLRDVFFVFSELTVWKNHALPTTQVEIVKPIIVSVFHA
jgi:hypothetical protein